MKMHELVTQFTRLLRAEDPDAVVEEYWRMDAPARLTYYVQPKSEELEQSPSMQEFARDMQLTVMIETPWVEPTVDGPRLSQAVEHVQAVCAANRQLVSGLVTLFGPVTYQFVTREGRATPNFAAEVTVTFRVPSHRGGM